MGLLWFSREKFPKTIHVYGDSKTLIDGAQYFTSYDPLDLRGLMIHAKSLIRSFQVFCIQHVYRESNTTVDSLSKFDLNDEEGAINSCHYFDGNICEMGTIYLP